MHQVQKLTDPDYSISGSEISLDGSLNMSWSHTSPASHGPRHGRSWTIAGPSFANMFPENLRQRTSREQDSSQASGQETPQHNMRLSDMLKRKRVSSRKSSRKSTGATREFPGTCLDHFSEQPKKSQKGPCAMFRTNSPKGNKV